MGGEELKWRQLAHYQPMSQPRTSFQSILYCQGDVAFASVHYEKTRLKKLIMIIIIIMNKSQETTVFSRCQKLSSAMKLRPEK